MNTNKSTPRHKKIKNYIKIQMDIGNNTSFQILILSHSCSLDVLKGNNKQINTDVAN